MTAEAVTVGSIRFANDAPFVLVGGMNVIEGEDIVLRVAQRFVDVTESLGIPYVFKASFDKANRSSINSFRGPGLEEGLKVLQRVKNEFAVPLLTDVHEPHQAASVAEVVDILQVPAFLQGRPTSSPRSREQVPQSTSKSRSSLRRTRCATSFKSAAKRATTASSFASAARASVTTTWS